MISDDRVARIERRLDNAHDRIGLMRVRMVTGLPTASAALRGSMLLVAGTPDQLYVCRQTATSGTYEWKALTT